METLEARRLLSANVLNYHNDNASTGVNSNENELTPTNVKVGSFGKLFSTTLDGQVYAQPLIDSSVSITTGVNNIGGYTGTYNVCFVCTENDSIYAINAGPGGGQILWQRSFTNTSNASGDTNNPLNATSVTTVPQGDTGSTDITPVIGITGTPVIDSARNLLYVVVATKEVVGGVTDWVQRLHAINLSNGTDAVAPYSIGITNSSQPSYENPNTNTTQIYVYGDGDGDVTDPYNNTGKSVVQFNALRENQRSALSLVNNTVYVSWASHGDNGPYHGWVVSWNVSNITTSGFALSGVLNTCPNESESGVWMGGGQIVFEPDDSAFYFTTGNGSGGPSVPTLGANGLPTDGTYNEAIVKAETDTTTSPTNQNANGWGMKIVDFFIPYNVADLDAADSDFGSGAPVLLPPSMGIPGHPNLMIASGKDGRIYILDRDDLGGYNANGDDVINAVLNTSNIETPPTAITGQLNTDSVFNGKIYVLPGYGGPAVSFTITPGANNSASLTPTSTSSITNLGYEPGSTSISANGTSNGIVWVEDRNANVLRAYDANTFGTELWDSSQAANNADAIGALIKFNTPAIANGEVYVGTSDALVVYGLTPAASKAPSPPVLTATTLSSSSINLTWTDPSTAPNIASGYLIDEDVNNTLVPLTTAAAGATSLAVGGLSAQTTYVFEIAGFNGIGDSNWSNTATATTSTGSGGGGVTTSPNAPSGLGASPASATSVTLNWTNNAPNEAGFLLDRATDSGFTQNLITQTLPTTPYSFTDTASGLAPGNTYYYRIRATNSAGPSGNSNTASATIPVAPPKATLQSITAITTTSITMAWQDNAGHLASGYEILRAANNGAFNVVATLPPTSRTAPDPYGWTDTTCQPGVFYEYHIEAYNVAGYNDFAGVNATTLTNPPVVTPYAGNNLVTLVWPAVTGAVSYNVYRSTISGSEALYQSDVTTTTTTDSAVTNGTPYYYTVTAVNSNASPLPSESAPSSEVSVTPGVNVSSPLSDADIGISAPSPAGSASFANGIYTVAGSGGDIWNNSDQFNFDSTAFSGNGTLITQVDSQTVTDPWAKAGLMFRDSSVANGANFALLATPGNGITLQWRTTDGAYSSNVNVLAGTTVVPSWLEIIRNGNVFTASYSTQTTTNPAAVTWTAIGSPQTITMPTVALAGLAVTAHNNSSLSTATFGNFSLGSISTTTGTTIPSAPASLTPTPGVGQIALSWAASTGATSYDIFRGTSPSKEGTSPYLTSSTTTDTDTAVSTGTTYYYTVEAVNSAGTSAPSPEATATPTPSSGTGALSDADVGGPGKAGSASYANGVYTVTGGGADIWNNSDVFNFDSESVSGNATLITQVDSQTITDPWAKAGLMFRDTSALVPSEAINFSIFVTGSNGIFAQSRTTYDGQSSGVQVTPASVPTWLEIVRNGNVFTAYYSTQTTTNPAAVTWTQLTSQTISMTTSAQAGLAVTAHNNSSLSTATFGNFSLGSSSTTTGTTIPSAPASLTPTPGVGQIALSWAASTGATSYDIFRGTSPGKEGTSPYLTSSTTTDTDTAVSTGTTYYYTVEAVNSAGTSAPSPEATATPTPSSGTGALSDADVGGPGKAGSASYANGVYTVTGGGADIWNNSDVFNFDSESVSGNATLITQVDSQTITDPWAKAGLMFRDTSALVPSEAINFSIFVTGSNGIFAQSRTTYDGQSSGVQVTPASVPTWLEIVRNGNVFTAYYSTQTTTNPAAVTWTQLTSQTISMTTSAQAGLAVTAHNNSSLSTATFSNVALS
jgi:fibronectin type 3 domain-containing protein